MDSGSWTVSPYDVIYYAINKRWIVMINGDVWIIRGMPRIP